MSNNSAPSAVHSSHNAHGSMATSSTTTEKYPVITASSYPSYPEVAPIMTQPPLQTFQQPHAGYAQQQYQHHNGYSSAAEQQVPKTQKLNPCGLSPLAFGLVVAAITALIVGVAVGGGVAGAMSGNNDDSSSSSNSTSASIPTVTVTVNPTATVAISSGTATALPLPASLENYLAAEPYYVSSLSDPGCTNANSHLTVQYNTSFDLFCGVDMQNSISDETNPDLMVADFVGIFAYSITDCLYACANAIHFQEQWDGGFTGCKGVTWQMSMSHSNSSDSANCWLKNGTTSGFQCNTCISAKLAT